jgi:hypothetical protein
MLPLSAPCVGIYARRHFNILALLPFSILGIGAHLFFAMVVGTSFFESACAVGPLIVMQVGFMLGLTGRKAYRQVLAKLKIARSTGI